MAPIRKTVAIKPLRMVTASATLECDTKSDRPSAVRAYESSQLVCSIYATEAGRTTHSKEIRKPTLEEASLSIFLDSRCKHAEVLFVVRIKMRTDLASNHPCS